MAEFISFKPIRKTRKPHRCTACNDSIAKGDQAYAWTSVDHTISTSHLHHECGEDVLKYCFSCKQCDDGDGFPEVFILEAMHNDSDCEPCKRLKAKEESGE